MKGKEGEREPENKGNLFPSPLPPQRGTHSRYSEVTRGICFILSGETCPNRSMQLSRSRHVPGTSLQSPSEQEPGAGWLLKGKHPLRGAVSAQLAVAQSTIPRLLAARVKSRRSSGLLARVNQCGL